MNSSNLQPRLIVHNTCELSIDDKKSPFPTWMKFNKLSPLRFSLNVQDPDRPELEPMMVSGDRNKLEELHRTVEDYVKELLQRTPLPQLSSGEGQEKPPHGSEISGFLGNDIDSLVKNRPIDALNVNDDRPHIESDGLSRHLFYLGNGADANTTVMSLSTLQLFDLSSALSEGLIPVTSSETEQSADPSIAAEQVSEPVILLPPEPMTNNNNKVVTPLQANVEEPRVVLPSVDETKSDKSDDLYELETESSIFERSTANRDRFKKPKPGLGSLNLPELPDFSQSPLTSIPLWLGLGGMAALIVAFPFISSTFKTGGSVAKKPATPTTQVSVASGDIPPEYQPTTPSIPNGVGTPTVGGLPVPNSTLGGAVGGLTPPAGTITTVPVSPSGVGNLTGGSSLSNSLDSTSPSINNNSSATQRQQTAGTGASGQRAANTTNAQSAVTSRPIRGASADGITQQARIPVNQNLQPPAIDDDPRLKPQNNNSDLSSDSSARPRSRQKNPPVVANRNSTSDIDGAVVGQANEFTGSGSGIFKPVDRPPTNNSGNLDAPSISPVESVQTRGLQGYFQGRWKADPNFDESLQYRVNVAKNGRVLSIEGQTEKSRVYLNKTGFLKPGEVVSPSGRQDQKVWLILNPTGDVQTLADSE
jgi:Domain of unknown function (DUF4335)